MALRHVRIFGRDANMAPAARIIGRGHFGRFGDRQAAMADAEIDRRVEFGIIELGQHIGADDTDLRGAMRDESGDVERADADQVDAGMIGRKAQRAAVLVGECCLGLDAGADEQRHGFRQDTALGDGND
jgi:hypothetical protein